MGIVYKARHLRLKRLVALKVIRFDREMDREGLARFEIEAEAVARLKHPNIVGIYEIGSTGSGPFVALELLEGGTLKARLAGTPQPVREAATLLSTLARAVNVAHAAGILHRDLKPSNVLFDREGVPKIADFGLAKRLDVEEGETLTGQVLGTPSYMAPEQAKGWAREIDHAVDIYSLGAILYEMLTGRPPITGATYLETLKLVQDEDPVSPSRLRANLPFDLETICLKCLARDPRKRYPSALALAEDLDRYLGGEPILARRTPFWERAIKLAHKHPAICVLLAAAVVAVVVAAVVLLRASNLENSRIRGLVQTGQQEILEAQRALADEHWEDVGRISSRLLSRVENERDDRLVRLSEQARTLDDQARQLQAKQNAEEAARDKMRAFRGHRDETLFLDTRFGGLDPEHAVEATCRAARAGLGVFGNGWAGDEWTLGSFPAELSAQQRDEVERGFYELLLVLADAVSQLPEAVQPRRAEAALRIIGRAPAVRSRATRAYHLRRSAYLDMKGDRAGATRERDEAEHIPPADAFDFFLAGRELTKKGDWKGAIKHLEAATQKQPDHFWAQCLLAICHLQVKEPSKAWLGFSACLQQRNDRPWLYLLRGIANAGEGKRARDMAGLYPDQAASLSAIASQKFEAAETDYRAALKLLGNAPADAELHYVLLVNRGHIRLERGDLPPAAADLQEAIRRNGRRFEAYSGLAHVYARQNRRDDALAQLTRAVELQPNLPHLHRAWADFLLGLERSAADLRDVRLEDLESRIRKLSAEEHATTLRELEEAVRSESPGAPGLIAVDRTKQAALFSVARRHEEALKACEAALGSAPGLALAHEIRVRELHDLRRHEELERSCDLALKYCTLSAFLFGYRGMAREGLEDYRRAIDDYTESLLLHPKKPQVLLRRRGWCYLARGANQLALDDFDDVIKLTPEDADAFSGRGLARALMGRHEEAIMDAGQSLHLGPKSWRIAYNAASIYAQAAVAVDTESRKTGPPAVRVVNRYLDQSVNLIRRAMELAPAEQRASLRDTMKKDPMLGPIRRRLDSLDRVRF
jgi:tetratricopeptide (TPR) repeat protein